MYDPQSQSLMVLCECSERVNLKTIPLDVVPVDGRGLWTLHGPTSGEEATAGDEGGDVPLAPGDSFPATDGPTESDMAPPGTTQGNSAESIIRAVGDLLLKTMKPQESNVFRRLRAYSGITPTPTEEENLDMWTEQARLMVEECDCLSREKRKRIVESLKGPALEIAQAVRANNPEATPQEYIEALERAFGTSETPEDLYFSFRALRQSSGERLSDFLRRVERLLTKVVDRGGLLTRQRDGARVEQLLRGAVESDLLLLQLRLRERKNNPPSFLELLNEIRQEEDQQPKSAPHPAKPMVRQVRVNDEAKLTDKEVQDLKAQIELLQSQVSELTIGSLKATTKLPKEVQTEKQSKAKSNSEVQALKKQVESLQNQIGVMTVTHTETRPTRGSSWRADPRENKGSHDSPNRQSYKGQSRD